MENNRDSFFDDSIDLDTLLVVFLNKVDALVKIFLISFSVLLFFYITDQRVYQSSSLIHFEQGVSNLFSNNNVANTAPMTRSLSLSSSREIYKSLPTIIGARDRIIKDNILDVIPSVGEMSSGINFSSNDSNLLTVRFNYIIQEDTKIVLDYLNQEFLDDTIENNQLRAKKGIEFVDNEIPKINILLTEAEQNLTEFRLSSGKYLIFENENRGQIIESLETRIKDIEFKELELKEFYKTSHPIFLTLIEQKNILKDELDSIEQNIKDIPSEQQTLFNLQKKVDLYATSLETLEREKLNLNLSAASSLSNIRIVNNASDAGKISPKINILLFAFVFLFIGYIYFLIDHLLTNKIISVDSLMDYLDDRKKFIGAFPLMDLNNKRSTEILKDIEKNNLDRSVISILETKDKVNIVSSMKGGVGKTYFSIKMFEKLVSLGKKVCLVDFDLRKKGLSFKYKKSDYKFIPYEEFEVKENNFESCIVNRPQIEDPLKFLSSDKIDSLFNKLRAEYDYVLVDTSPMGTFIDSKLLSSKVDSVIVLLASHFSTFSEISMFQKEIASLDKKDIELKFFLNKVQYFLEIFRFKIRYPLYGNYAFYDVYYNIGSNAKGLNLSKILKYTKHYFLKFKSYIINFFNIYK
tara:strand:+ start:752 stop:2656 length:1905 start_codon:yes stop_codon:yes gene_type:complete